MNKNKINLNLKTQPLIISPLKMIRFYKLIKITNHFKINKTYYLMKNIPFKIMIFKFNQISKFNFINNYNKVSNLKKISQKVIRRLFPKSTYVKLPPITYIQLDSKKKCEPLDADASATTLNLLFLQSVDTKIYFQYLDFIKDANFLDISSIAKPI